MRIEVDREEDGRWIAEIPELPGVTVYGSTVQRETPQYPRRRLLPCVFLPTGSNMERRFPN